MPMRMLHTMIRVGDLERSLRFYCEVLGMKLLRRKDYESGRFTLAFVDLLGPITVDLAAGTASSSDMSATGLSYVRYVGATHGNDTLKGGGADVAFEAFVGNSGNDDIDGGAGFDFVFYDDEEDYGAATIGGTVVPSR